MRANWLLLLLAGTVQLPFGWAEDKPSDVVRMARRISVNEFGGLSAKHVEQSDVPVFDLGGHDWFIELKGDQWLIRCPMTSGDAGVTRFYLGFETKQTGDAKQSRVVLREKSDESCLWLVEADEKSGPLDPKRSEQYCYLKVSSGDFKGWYLTPGEPTKIKNDIVLERSAALSKVKSAKSRLRFWVDGK